MRDDVTAQNARAVKAAVMRQHVPIDSVLTLIYARDRQRTLRPGSRRRNKRALQKRFRVFLLRGYTGVWTRATSK